MPEPMCPTCGRTLPPPREEGGGLRGKWPHFPFCSERCRLLDLGAWLSGRYAIPGRPARPEELPPDPGDAD